LEKFNPDTETKMLVIFGSDAYSYRLGSMPLAWLIAVDTYVSCTLVTPYMIQISRKEVFVIVVIGIGLDRKLHVKVVNISSRSKHYW